MSSNYHRGPEAGQWHLLVSTNRGLEEVAVRELESLAECTASVHYPGMVRCTGGEEAIYRFHARARSIHRVMLELVRAECRGLDSISDLVESLDIPAYLGPEQSFAVRAQRRGEHDFTSMDVEREGGQAIVDKYRSRKRTRPPVDLDDPAVIFRVYVRSHTVAVTVDTTGQQSLHRRQYRVSEHEAPLRPTIAYAMCQYAAPEPGDRLVDPMCGCGTIPIEAAQADLSRPPLIGRDPTLVSLRFLDPARYRELLAEQSERSLSLDIAGFDVDEAAIVSARENGAAAGLGADLAFETADATAAKLDANLIVTDMPFGIRTEGGLRSLYAGFFGRLGEVDWRRLVVHTARSDLVPLEPTRTIAMRRGRLETEILVID